MRHYVSYDAAGQFVGVHTHKFARGGLGGWPEGFDLENGLEAVNADARAMAERLLTKFPDRITGFMVYDCPCPATKGACRCPNDRRIDHVANDDRTALVAKPACAIMIDDVLWDGESEVVRPDGTEISVKVQCAEAPDDSTVSVVQGATPRLWTPLAPVELVFSGGETNEHTIYAPPRGLTGVMQFYGPCTTLLTVKVLGWG